MDREKQKNFGEIKKDGYIESMSPCHANSKGHFTLVSDTIGVACGAAVYQEQRRKVETRWIKLPQQ